ncbi:MAG: TIGR00730 family Rossman fold protein [Prevotellaceae bacterium]|jgi:uncharacterized protein (TIGR00730 family)|nr:TIGR00730 family Rossman fold protein [Prevotellaceae bacterium]
MNKILSVCVYGASSNRIAPVYIEAARELGTLIGQHGIRLINGAGSAGLMLASSTAAMAAGGKATGIIPRFMVDEGWGNSEQSEMLVVESMHERKQMMANMSDAVIALPGGIGTLEEMLEIITWKQLGLYLNPIVILNINGYYDLLLAMLNHAMEEHFMRTGHAALWEVATTPQEAIELIYSLPLWDKTMRKFAAI